MGEVRATVDRALLGQGAVRPWGPSSTYRRHRTCAFGGKYQVHMLAPTKLNVVQSAKFLQRANDIGFEFTFI